MQCPGRAHHGGLLDDAWCFMGAESPDRVVAPEGPSTDAPWRFVTRGCKEWRIKVTDCLSGSAEMVQVGTTQCCGAWLQSETDRKRVRKSTNLPTGFGAVRAVPGCTLPTERDASNQVSQATGVDAA